MSCSSKPCTRCCPSGIDVYSDGDDACAFDMQFDSLAFGCLKAWRGEEAEQLFDERDDL